MTESSDEQNSRACPSCGAAFTGPYCSQCGEKALNVSEKSIRNFIGTVLNEATSLDGKFLKTLRLMLRRPGEMSYQYMNGKRIPFYKPVSMFFIANLLYFLFPLFNSLNSSLHVQMNMLPYSELATRLVEQHIAAANIDLRTFEIQYNQQSTNMAKMVLILMVVMFSVPLMLMNYTKKMFYSDHLLVSLEACSLIILLNFVGLIWVVKLSIVAAGWAGFDIRFVLQDSYVSPISMALLLYIFYQLERRAYSQSIWKAIGKSAILVLGFYFVLQLYRASLFFITLLTL